MNPRQGLGALVCAAVLCLLASSGVCLAHGGPPLRIGVTADPVVSAVARLVLVHLREGVGFSVDWREYPDENALRSAFASGRIDIAVALTSITGSAAGAAAPDCSRESIQRRVDDLARVWGGAAFALRFSTDPAACVVPALVLARAVLDDPRFGILGKEAGLIAALITRDDLDAVRGAHLRGGERAATAAARAALAAKAGR